MNYGKISENVFDRTVYKTIQTLGYHDQKSAPLNKHKTSAIGHASGKDQTVAFRAIQHALNSLASFGNTDIKGHISLDISMSEKLREAKLRTILERAAVLSDEIRMEIVNVQVHVVPGVDTFVVSASVECDNDSISTTFSGKARPGQNIVMTKWMGLEGSSLISTLKLDELSTRYPLGLIEKAMEFDRFLSVVPEAATAVKSDASAMQAVCEGGVFGALWELASSSDVGLVVDLKKIPVKQETIEVCEYFDINPYKLLSGGSLLITTDRGMNLVSELKRQNIEATVIGNITDSNDRIIVNEDETRYLELPREDSFYEVM